MEEHLSERCCWGLECRGTTVPSSARQLLIRLSQTAIPRSSASLVLVRHDASFEALVKRADPRYSDLCCLFTMNRQIEDMPDSEQQDVT